MQLSLRYSLQIYCTDEYKLFNCEVLIDILCSDCGFLTMSELIFTSSYAGVYLKAESSKKKTEYIPGGRQVKPNIITIFDKKQQIILFLLEGDFIAIFEKSHFQKNYPQFWNWLRIKSHIFFGFYIQVNIPQDWNRPLVNQKILNNLLTSGL